MTLTYNVTVTDSHLASNTQSVTVTHRHQRRPGDHGAGPGRRRHRAGHPGRQPQRQRRHHVQRRRPHRRAPGFGHRHPGRVGTLGSLTAVKDTDTTGTGSGGQLTWTYTVADAAVEYLAKDQTKVESFTITLDDQNGGLITKQIDVTITGTNDAPVITAQDLIGAVTEQVTPAGNLTDSGTIAFTDVDLTDVHLVSATGVPGRARRAHGERDHRHHRHRPGWRDDLELHGRGFGGRVPGGQGQTKVETFTITLDDQNGGHHHPADRRHHHRHQRRAGRSRRRI